MSEICSETSDALEAIQRRGTTDSLGITRAYGSTSGRGIKTPDGGCTMLEGHQFALRHLTYA
jgi:hypothetical protein